MSYEFRESDWKLYRKKCPGWQEAFMERLNREYAILLIGPGQPSTKFWKLDKLIRGDRKRPGVIIEHSRSRMFQNFIWLIGDGVITHADLEGFSQELRDALSEFHSFSERP